MPEDDFAQEREAMVETQILGRGIKDPRVLDAMRKVPRHVFVPDHLKPQAYEDRPLKIGSGQTISQPYMVGLMTALLDVHPGHRVLEVGTGSGYQAAILAHLTSEVYTIERIAFLSSRAREVLGQIGVDNVSVETRDGTLGWPEKAPFDRILVTAGAPEIPVALEEQLAIGGKLVCPVGTSERQMLMIVYRTQEGWVREESVGCMFVPLIGKGGWRN